MFLWEELAIVSRSTTAALGYLSVNVDLRSLRNTVESREIRAPK